MKRNVLTVVYVAILALIIYLADRPSSQFVFQWIRAIPGGDKMGHFLLIGGFSFLVNYSLSCRILKIVNRSFLLGSLIVLALITLEEFSQLFIPTRTFDLLDLLFDYLGIWFFGKLAGRIVHHSTPSAAPKP